MTLPGKTNSALKDGNVEDEEKEEREVELVAKARRGDWEALEELVKTCGSRIYNVCNTILKSDEDARDAVENSLLKAKKGLPGFQERSEFCTWFYRIAVNVCLDECRRRKRQIDADAAALIIELAGDRSKKGIVQTSDRTSSFEESVVEKIYIQQKVQQRKKAIKAKVEQIVDKKQRWDAFDFQVYMLQDEGYTYEEMEQHLKEAATRRDKIKEVLRYRYRMSAKIKPVLDEVDIEAKMREQAETRWDETDIRMFSARVARGKELRQTRFLFFKKTTAYSKEQYQKRIVPVLEDAAIGIHANSNATARTQPEDRWNVPDIFLFQKFILEGADYAEIVALSRKPESAHVAELGQRSDKETAEERCRSRYHQRIKRIVIDTINGLR